MTTLPSADEANEETGINNHDEDDYCQHKFILDVVDSEEFEDADSILISIGTGDEVTNFAWGGSLIELRGLAEIAADSFRQQEYVSD